MKTLIAMLAVLGLVVGGGIWSNNRLETSAHTLNTQVNKVMADVGDEQWTSAQSGVRRLNQEWHRQGKWWPVFLDHQEMDNIDFALARAEKYVYTRDRALALGEFSELRSMIEHLPEKEAVNMKNIL